MAQAPMEESGLLILLEYESPLYCLPVEGLRALRRYGTGWRFWRYAARHSLNGSGGFHSALPSCVVLTRRSDGRYDSYWLAAREYRHCRSG